jgi:hypothetical protein
MTVRLMTKKKDLEGSGRGLIDVLPRLLPRRAEENHEIPENSRCSSLDSNKAPQEFTVLYSSLAKTFIY